MNEIARLPAGVVFLALLVPSVFSWADWRIASLGWLVLLGWYLVVRWRLAESREYTRHPVYVLFATVSLFSVPMISVLAFVVGDSGMDRFAEQFEDFVVPIIALAMLFVLYSAWTAAKSLVVSEEVTAADRAVRWERTLKTFLAMYFWPVGVWWVQKRVRAATE